MHRIAVVEDSRSDRETLMGYLRRFFAEHGEECLILPFSDAAAFLGQRAAFDLVLLDIDMPGMTGMEAATLLRGYDNTTPLVFVTNLAQYALRGYEVDALDFIVKPVSWGSFSVHMEKALRAMRRLGRRSIRLDVRGKGLHVVARDEVMYVEVLRHDLTYHLEDGQALIVRGTLAQAYDELGRDMFVRVSKSHLVNMEHVSAVHPASITLSNGEQVSLTRTYRRKALAAVADYLGGDR